MTEQPSFLPQRVLVTGGAGFIGLGFVRHLLSVQSCQVLNVDALTYASAAEGLSAVERSERYSFVRASICDRERLRQIIDRFSPDAVVHLAAETHVDRSIDAPEVFVETNVSGTGTLLQETLRHWQRLDSEKREDFRFLHVSTDEVYGSRGPQEPPSTEASVYAPSSPYAASKASADHLVRAWHRTYGLPTIITICSNNYGPFQHPEKFIPRIITRALAGESMPIYGDGTNVRDWLFVDDHVRALWSVLTAGRPGESYNIGGGSVERNIDVAQAICRILDRKRERRGGHGPLIRFVDDRPAHDMRYALDTRKIAGEIGWSPKVPFEHGLEQTVTWYIEHGDWCRSRRRTAGAHDSTR